MESSLKGYDDVRCAVADPRARVRQGFVAADPYLQREGLRLGFERWRVRAQGSAAVLNLKLIVASEKNGGRQEDVGLARRGRACSFTPHKSFRHSMTGYPRALGRERYTRADKDGQCRKVFAVR